jgi:Tfp pilus assembly protein PilF
LRKQVVWSPLTVGNAEIAEEVELGRTLLIQGHLETAQRVLLQVCQAQPECAEAFRVLGLVLSKRGDEKRADKLMDWANELDAQPTSEIPSHVSDAPSDAETKRNRLPAPPPAPVRPAAVPAPSSRPAPTPYAPPAPVVIAAPVVRPPAPLPPPAAVGPPPAIVPPRLPNYRRGGVLIAFFAGVAVVASGVAIYSQRHEVKPPRPSSRKELDHALAAGTLEALMRGRDVARINVESGEVDRDGLVRLGLVNAFLVLDYDVDARKDAERALERALQGPESSPERVAFASTARSLLALAAGDRATARQQVDAAIAAQHPDPPVYAFLASARVRNLAGDTLGAARDLDRAMGIANDVAPVQVDWAASRLDQGDPVAARRSLVGVLEKDAEYSRARLLLADAERALGEAGWTKDLDTACKSDAKISRNVRALCAVGSAAQSRLEGDRGGALRKTKAAAQTTEDPQALAQMSLIMALLGEIDGADDLLGRAAKTADPAAVALRWADLAIRLGRGEKGPALPKLENPAGPERDFVALRAAYARAGAGELSTLLKTLPPGIADIDWEIRTFAKLAHDGAMPKADALVIEKRAERWNPVASYVLGVFAVRDKDFKLAARRLEKALSWHGDSCAAAAIYADAVKRAGRPFQLNKVALKSLHARNAKCPLPAM